MRFSTLWLAFALCAAPPSLFAQTATPELLTLAEAMRLAETAHPLVRTRQAQLVAAEALRQEAAAPFFNNPDLSLERTHRDANAPDSSSKDWGLGISQRIEMGGQQARRREAAASMLESLKQEVEDARQQARAEAALRFYAVHAALGRVDIEQRSVELLTNTARVVGQLRAAGENTRLDANIAMLEAEKARNMLSLAHGQLAEAKAELANALQLPPGASPKIVAPTPGLKPSAMPYQLDQLLAAAQKLPKQQALALRESAALARLGVERANRSPDLTLGLNIGREGVGDFRQSVTTISISVPLPFFKRNGAPIGQAMADLTQAELDRGTGMREASAQVRRLWNRLISQSERVQRLQGTMLPAAMDNQQLAAKSRQAGQIGLIDQLIINRQALDAERELHEVLTEYNITRIELENAAGWPKQGLAR